MYTIEELQDIVNNVLSSQKFEGNPPLLYEPIRYSLSQGGKRLRPLLTLLGCDLFDGDVYQAIYPALGLEIFHNFTLLHDDIMDKAPLRRGMETVYKKWNTNIAILSGDTMFALAYEYMLKTNQDVIPDILKVLNRTAIEVCEGQQYDMNFETQENVNISDYLEMIRLKTAVLLGACLKIGSIIAKTNEENIRRIYNFGLNLGIAFQLKDDLLDTYANDTKFGKVIGGDISTNKKTFLYLKAYELADKKQKEMLDYLFSLPEEENENKIKEVTALFNALNIKDHTEIELNKYQNIALDELKYVTADKSKIDRIINFANNLLLRES
jgi:geranylgeranyl diphosphate synthase type II